MHLSVENAEVMLSLSLVSFANVEKKGAVRGLLELKWVSCEKKLERASESLWAFVVLRVHTFIIFMGSILSF